ncbi:MAG: ribulokinase [Dysgonamonadaceae bacterium]|nr:ribulokinase [Dysgonamonadaceae bacterium]
MRKLVIGIDFGTDSCRALVVDIETGRELSASVAFYPRWKRALYCDAANNQYRQHPQDYIDAFVEAIRGALSQLPEGASDKVCAIGIDTTGSTPCLIDKRGTPLALLPQHAENPNAMFVLWKDHTSIREANEINELSHRWHTDYTSRSGGIYSSEWFWAKALHVLREDESIRKDAYGIIEHCDWMTALLTGNETPETLKRSRCAAGHKGMWAEEWGGYPPQEFLSALDSLFDGFASRLPAQTYTADISAGELSEKWGECLGLPQGIAVAVGILDAHAGAIGAGIQANTMVKIVGTSTCDIVVSPETDLAGKLIPGISGQVDGSVVPGLIGLEAGQSAFGDIYAWLKRILSWTLSDENLHLADSILPKLNDAASQIAVTENDAVACDWFNGRRTPYADQSLKGGIVGLTLGTSPAHLFKALVEATAFGSKAIMEHIEKQGVKIIEVIGVGGIALKSPYVMQMLSNVMNVPIKVAATQQAGALGAVMCAAVASGCFASVEEAQEKLGQGVLAHYHPETDKQQAYKSLYNRYLSLCDNLIEN